jgi:aerobic-type carbon monoxide dehydrogenase small subunit (CoxS/CutS family)
MSESLSETRAVHETRVVRTTVNGVEREAEVATRLTLADFLRHELRLTGTHIGCEHGVCGACTVRVDGAAVRSCLMLAVQANGRRIDTVEGLAGADGTLAPIQEAFSKHHALQCGFCTSGFLMSVAESLEEEPIQTEERARDVLGGNICRCTGYAGMVEAVLEASQVSYPSANGEDA